MENETTGQATQWDPRSDAIGTDYARSASHLGLVQQRIATPYSKAMALRAILSAMHDQGLSADELRAAIGTVEAHCAG